MEHSLHSPFKRQFWPRPRAPGPLEEKGPRCCFDHLFGSETNYGIKDSGAKPGIQLINPHLLTETVVGPSQHVSPTVTQSLSPGPSVMAPAQAEERGPEL